MFEDCGTPRLSFLEEERPDGSKTMISVDLNGAKVKLFLKVDVFITEFAGKDLRNVVFRDVDKYLSAAIENEVKKKAAATTYQI